MSTISTVVSSWGIDIAIPVHRSVPRTTPGAIRGSAAQVRAAVSSQVENLNGEYRMSAWPRKMTALVLAAVLTAGVSCTNDALGPSEPAAPDASALTAGGQESLLLGGILDGLKNLNLLSCSPQPYVSVTQ